MSGPGHRFSDSHTSATVILFLIVWFFLSCPSSPTPHPIAFLSGDSSPIATAAAFAPSASPVP